MIYLAAPYSSENPSVRYSRVTLATNFAAHCWAHGLTVFSPISYSQLLIDHVTTLPRTHEFWMPHDFNILRKCDDLWVLRLEGWDTSRGIAEELEVWEEMGNKTFALVDYTDRPWETAPKRQHIGAPLDA